MLELMLEIISINVCKILEMRISRLINCDQSNTDHVIITKDDRLDTWNRSWNDCWLIIVWRFEWRLEWRFEDELEDVLMC